MFLIAMFIAFGAGARSTGMTLGFVNDTLGWVSCLLALPAVVAIHALVRRVAPALSLALWCSGWRRSAPSLCCSCCLSPTS